MNATHLDLPEPATAWAESLDWRPAGGSSSASHAPMFYRATLTAAGGEATFLVMDGWGHGVVFVNDVNVGRFSCLGPVKTLYVPTGVLAKGENNVYIFETDRLGVANSARTVTSVAAGPLWMNRTQLAAAAAARVVLKSDELPCPFGSGNSIPRSGLTGGSAGEIRERINRHLVSSRHGSLFRRCDEFSLSQLEALEKLLHAHRASDACLQAYNSSGRPDGRRPRHNNLASLVAEQADERSLLEAHAEDRALLEPAIRDGRCASVSMSWVHHLSDAARARLHAQGVRLPLLGSRGTHEHGPALRKAGHARVAATLRSKVT